MGIFDARQTNEKRNLSQLTEEETKELAFSYASADWHNVKGTLDNMKIDYNEDDAQLSLYYYKLGLLKAKQERKFKLPDNI